MVLTVVCRVVSFGLATYKRKFYIHFTIIIPAKEKTVVQYTAEEELRSPFGISVTVLFDTSVDFFSISRPTVTDLP